MKSKYEEIAKSYPRDFGSNRANADGAIHKYQNLKSPSNRETIDEADRALREAEKWDAIIDAVKVLTNAVNGSDAEMVAKAMFMGLAKSHRTLQAKLFSAIFKMFNIYKDSSYDLRNVSAVIASAQVTQFAEDEYIRFPLI